MFLEALVNVKVEIHEYQEDEFIIEIDDPRFSDEHIPGLVQAFQGLYRQVSLICFSDVALTEKGLAQLKDIMVPPFQLHQIRFHKEKYHKVLQAFGDLIVHPDSTLRHLHLWPSQCEKDAFVSFCRSLESYDCVLQTLHLSTLLYVQEEEKQSLMMAFAKALGQNTSVTSLTIKSCDGFDETVMEAFSKSMAINHTLKSLTLQNCELGNTVTLKILCDGIQSNCTLTKLDLSLNFIDNQGKSNILCLLQNNYTLTSVDPTSPQIEVLCNRNIAMRKKRLSLMPMSRKLWNLLCRKMLF